MERLTERDENGKAWAKCDKFSSPEHQMQYGREALERLASYEDTGLEPEEIERIKNFLQGGVHQIDTEWTHIQDLLTAEKDNRLLKVPCIRAFCNGSCGIAYELISWDEENGVMSSGYPTLEEAEAAHAEAVRRLKGESNV